MPANTAETPKDSLGKLDGTDWLTRDYTLRDIVSALKVRPDGICIDSGNAFNNNIDATALPIFGNKQAFVGWPVQEGIWREFRWEVRWRYQQVDDFYSGKMTDPLEWLLANNVRYVPWLQKDNTDNNERFVPLWNKIKSRYSWQHYSGDDAGWSGASGSASTRRRRARPPRSAGRHREALGRQDRA